MIKTMVDVVYDADKDLKLDYYLPEQPTGVVILIHGGGWFRGDKASMKDLALRLANDHLAVVAPNYRLIAESLFPGALADSYAVYEWVRQQAELSALPIGALGGSAGGNLAVELSLKYGIKAASWSGIIDLYDWVSHHPDVVPKNKQDPKVTDPKLIDQDGQNDAFYKWFILNYVGSDMQLLAQADPLQRVTAASGQLLLVNSTNEFVPISGTLMLAQKYAALDKAITIKLLSGTKHATAYEEAAYDETFRFFQTEN